MIINQLIDKINSKSIESVLCVKCPLNNNYVPLNGFCFSLTINEDGKGSIRIAGESEFITYNSVKKCKYAEMISTGGLTGNLKGVVCNYSVSKV